MDFNKPGWFIDANKEKDVRSQPPAYTRQLFEAIDSDKYGNEIGCDNSNDKFHDINPTYFSKFDVQITDAMANSNQVLHFRKKTSRHVLLENQQEIKVRDVETGRIFSSPIVTSSRSKYERYITETWNEYKVEKKLNAGDVLRCTIEQPSRYMNIEIIRRRCSGLEDYFEVI
ncbi:hypothetical protein TSUD_145480 [Trifolium subterraneum]|uniref:TF-B3 domain-containing protein n=1 Tax=Trifolium subterraneum TaxID=3900 RepID=A0A2Z6N3U4_TRISU|nr:hypothetical protein TSUD_145480 [Trifolium subterraneum]